MRPEADAQSTAVDQQLAPDQLQRRAESAITPLMGDSLDDHEAPAVLGVFTRLSELRIVRALIPRLDNQPFRVGQQAECQ